MKLSTSTLGQPSTVDAEQDRGADVFIHEIFPPAEEFAHYNPMPIQVAEGVMTEHTTPAELGEVYSIAKPRLGGGHFTLDDKLIDPLFQRWKKRTFNTPKASTRSRAALHLFLNSTKLIHL